MSSAPKPRPRYYDLNIAHLPPPGLVSIFHRISGFALFFPVVPALLYVLQATLGSEEGFARWRDFFAQREVKAIALGFVWLYAHHFWAGIRYLLLDVHWGIDKAPARASANAVLALGVVTTIAIGCYLW
jgi:succinate dehydrogenase / fumarate reductase cytochrome b subunit